MSKLNVFKRGKNLAITLVVLAAPVSFSLFQNFTPIGSQAVLNQMGPYNMVASYDNIWNHSWFGYFDDTYYAQTSYIYHLTFGWVGVWTNSTRDNFYFYVADQWYYTNRSMYPYFYGFGTSSQQADWYWNLVSNDAPWYIGGTPNPSSYTSMTTAPHFRVNLRTGVWEQWNLRRAKVPDISGPVQFLGCYTGSYLYSYINTSFDYGANSAPVSWDPAHHGFYRVSEPGNYNFSLSVNGLKITNAQGFRSGKPALHGRLIVYHQPSMYPTVITDYSVSDPILDPATTTFGNLAISKTIHLDFGDEVILEAELQNSTAHGACYPFSFDTAGSRYSIQQITVD